MSPETLKAFITRNQLTFSFTRIPARPDDNEGWVNARHWLVTFEREGKTSTQQAFLYSQGSAHTKAPTAEDVLDCLKNDASIDGNTFEQWADEIGYDCDSRKAEATYRACQASATKLKSLLGAAELQKLINETESL